MGRLNRTGYVEKFLKLLTNEYLYNNKDNLLYINPELIHIGEGFFLSPYSMNHICTPKVLLAKMNKLIERNSNSRRSARDFNTYIHTYISNVVKFNKKTNSYSCRRCYLKASKKVNMIILLNKIKV